MWTKLTDIKQAQLQDILWLACLVLFITFGMTFQSMFVIVIAILAIYLLAYFYYNRTISQHLELVNTEMTSRLYPEDNDSVTFTLINHGPYPYINGKLLFEVSDTIELDAPTLDHSTYSVPVTLYPKQKTSIKIPLTAVKRGQGRIYNIRFQFAHLLKFQMTTFRYNPYFHQGFIIFPSPKSVPHFNQKTMLQPGAKIVNFSPFEDLSQIQGIRDYAMTDSFRRINWKASLKAQTLQANQYENVTEETYQIVINIEYKQSQGQLLLDPMRETYYQYAAYLINYFEKSNVNYALSINIRKLGRMPYLTIAQGQGQAHQFKMLEQLALIYQHPLIYPAQNMIYKMGQQERRPQAIILIGELFPSMKEMMRTSWPNTYQVFHLDTDEPFGIHPLQVRRESSVR